ncbi:hypothetical protein GE09DRAFT_1195572 [Coniochaeta sp. 2T2.1]|nr:hypothetical protein GE09DRAFT_1195572 [Coniochaeta sp. 2T2.1]
MAMALTQQQTVCGIHFMYASKAIPAGLEQIISFIAKSPDNRGNVSTTDSAEPQPAGSQDENCLTTVDQSNDSQHHEAVIDIPEPEADENIAPDVQAQEVNGEEIIPTPIFDMIMNYRNKLGACDRFLVDLDLLAPGVRAMGPEWDLDIELRVRQPRRYNGYYALIYRFSRHDDKLLDWMILAFTGFAAVAAVVVPTFVWWPWE